jgi:hypothetical protein
VHRRGQSRLAVALVLAALLAAGARAENRVEALSTGNTGLIPDEVDVNLVEVDVAGKTSVGFRRTDLGSRSDTNELYFRLVREKQTAAMDPRDRRQGGMKNPLAGLGTFHVGLVGIETDGSRGNPMAIRAGVYGLGRLKEDLMGVTEFGYQSGTFGGDGTKPTNKAGMHARMGFRKGIAKNFYGEVDYSFSPGTEEDWVPGVRLGMQF